MTVSVRVNNELRAKIQERFPDFGQDSAEKGYKSKVILGLIQSALESDELQEICHEVGETKREIRDVKSTLDKYRKNISVVLKLVLLNVGADPAKVERIIEALKEEGLIF